MLPANHDPRKSYLVHGASYRKYGLAQRPEPKQDTLADCLAGLVMFAFLTAVGFWLGGLMT